MISLKSQNFCTARSYSANLLLCKILKRSTLIFYGRIFIVQALINFYRERSYKADFLLFIGSCLEQLFSSKIFLVVIFAV